MRTTRDCLQKHGPTLNGTRHTNAHGMDLPKVFPLRAPFGQSETLNASSSQHIFQTQGKKSQLLAERNHTAQQNFTSSTEAA